MKHADFNAFLINFARDMDKVLSSKGKDYSTEADRLDNFKQAAAQLGLTPIQIWWVYAWKHLSALAAFARNGKLESESLRSRFIDAANYMVLGAALAEDGKTPMSRWEMEAIKMRELTDDTLRNMGLVPKGMTVP